MKKTLLISIFNKMADEATVKNEKYSAFFGEATAADGVKAIMAAGKFFINGFPLPIRECDSFRVNTEDWMKREKGGWRVDRRVYPVFSDAVYALEDRLPAGVDVCVYDEDGDGFADRIETYCPDSLIAAKLEQNADGSFTVGCGTLDPSLPCLDGDGRAFAGEVEVSVAAEHMDGAAKQGDMVLLTREPDGWHLKRALELRGSFMGGQDHENYLFNGVAYLDAMRFSRGCIIVSNRNGEFANAQTYFGFDNDPKGREISFWLAPSVDYPRKSGAPLGFTCGDNSRLFLLDAIAAAKKMLSAGRTNAPQPAVEQLEAVIRRAEAALKSPYAAPHLLDYQVYVLYLAMHGSEADIGARFAGFSYPGFEQYVK